MTTSNGRQRKPTDFAIATSCFASGFSGNVCVVARSQTYSETGYQALSVTFMT